MNLLPMEVPSRIPRLRALLETAGCAALLVTTRTNVRYLTGFTGSAGVLLVTDERAVLVTDGRYGGQAAEEAAAAGAEVEVEVGNLARQDDILRAAAAGAGPVGLEAAHVSWARQRALAAGVFEGAEVVATEGLVEGLRKVKDAGELDRMQAAATIADAALAQVRGRLLERPTEREFALELDFAMRRLGAADVSFETIVASGPNGARPHARPADRYVEPGELVVVDFGALVDGYHSDMTRTLCVGDPATPARARMVEVVARAQAAGVAAVRGGVEAKAVDEACRGVIAEAGWDQAFVHGTGHGVGLDIHEQPMLSATAAGSLQPGYVVTVEPGVYLPAEGGARIEDSVLVTGDGCRHLTNAPKDVVIH